MHQFAYVYIYIYVNYNLLGFLVKTMHSAVPCQTFAFLLIPLCFLGFWKRVCGNYFAAGPAEMPWRLKRHRRCSLKFLNSIEGNLAPRSLKSGRSYSCEADRHEDITVLCAGIEEDWACLCENVAKWNCLCPWTSASESSVVALPKEIGIWLASWIDLVLREPRSTIHLWCGIHLRIACQGFWTTGSVWIKIATIPFRVPWCGVNHAHSPLLVRAEELYSKPETHQSDSNLLRFGLRAEVVQHLWLLRLFISIVSHDLNPQILHIKDLCYCYTLLWDNQTCDVKAESLLARIWSRLLPSLDLIEMGTGWNPCDVGQDFFLFFNGWECKRMRGTHIYSLP